MGLSHADHGFDVTHRDGDAARGLEGGPRQVSPRDGQHVAEGQSWCRREAQLTPLQGSRLPPPTQQVCSWQLPGTRSPHACGRLHLLLSGTRDRLTQCSTGRKQSCVSVKPKLML